MSSFVSHKYRLIFCHIPRTGGTSFTEAIRPHSFSEIFNRYEKHTPLKAFKVGEGDVIFDNYLKVAFIRDEAARMESLSKGSPKNAKSTDDYWWTFDKWICDDQGRPLADVLISFEGLPNSAVNFLNAISIYTDPIKYPHLNKRGK